MCTHLTKQEYTQYVIESRMLGASNPVKNSPKRIRLDFLVRRMEAYVTDARLRRDKTKTVNPYRFVQAPLVKDDSQHGKGVL